MSWAWWMVRLGWRVKKAGKKYSRGKGKSEEVVVEAIVSVKVLEERERDEWFEVR